MRSITCCSSGPSQTSLKEYSFALLIQDCSLYKESNRRTLTQSYSNNHASSCEFSLFSASSRSSQLLSFSASPLPLSSQLQALLVALLAGCCHGGLLGAGTGGGSCAAAPFRCSRRILILGNSFLTVEQKQKTWGKLCRSL